MRSKIAPIAILLAIVAPASAQFATNPTTPLGFYNSSLPTIISGQPNPLQLDANGRLIVNIGGGSGGGGGLPGSANLATAQTSIAATATLVAAARSGRNAITVVNAGTTAVYLGGSGVTTSTGTLLPGVIGASVTMNTQAAVYGIVATGSQTVTDFETY